MSEEQQAPGTMCWNEINTPNVASTVEFYSKLMGWTLQDMEMPNGNTYTMFMQGEKMIAGCVHSEDTNAPPIWLSYILVEDIDASTAKAKELGANIMMDRVDLPMGSFVVFSDPQGAVIAFWQNSGEDC